MIIDLAYQFQKICLWGTKVIEQKPNVSLMYGQW